MKLDKSKELAYEYKISSLFNFRKYREALQYLDEAIEINPHNHKFYNFKAFILTDLYQIDEAISCYSKSFILDGFEEDDTQLSEYLAKCYLKKAREDYYFSNDSDEALKSLNVYLKYNSNDEKASMFKQELTSDYAPFKYAEKLLYLEKKAEELYYYKYFEESYKSYQDVLKASVDFKNNVPNIEYLGYDFVNRTNIHELENFKWYDEVLSKCFEEFNGNYEEFFEKIYEISEDTIDACLDKAKLYSKVYGKDMTEKYVEKLVKICPSNPDVKEFHDRILYINNVHNVTEGCDEFKNYNSIEEYIEDVIVCIVASFPYYDEKKARVIVKKSEDFIKESYEKQWPAGEVSWEFAIW